MIKKDRFDHLGPLKHQKIITYFLTIVMLHLKSIFLSNKSINQTILCNILKSDRGM